MEPVTQASQPAAQAAPVRDDRPDLFADALDLDVAGVRGAELFDAFMGLSATLVASARLPRWVGRAYLRTLVANADGTTQPYLPAAILATLHTFASLPPGPDLEREVRARILGDTTCKPVAQAIAYLWYTAGLPAFAGVFAGYVAVTAPVETYATGLVWDAISAHPPGLPGPYYGSWSYPPPQPIERPPDAPRAASAPTTDAGTAAEAEP